MIDHRNLIEIKTVKGNSVSNEPIQNKVYTREHLYLIGTHVKENIMLRKLQPSLVVNIRSLRLNKKFRRKRGKRAGKHVRNKNCFEKKVNRNNVIQLERKVSRIIHKVDECIKLSTFNAQSIKNKDTPVRTLLEEEHIDIGIITETWLKESDEEEWICTSELNNDGWRFYSVPRKERSGGGVALVSKLNKIKQLESGARNTFEYGIWQVTSRNISLSIVGVYRPPYSEKNKFSINDFLDEYTDFLTRKMATLKNLLICGDFNIHFEDTENNESVAYREINEALGLTQCNNLATHRLGHNIDHVFVENEGQVKVINCETGSYSCGLSTATIEYSSLSVCLSVCLGVCLSVCLSVCVHDNSKNNGSIHLKLEHIVVY